MTTKPKTAQVLTLADQETEERTQAQEIKPKTGRKGMTAEQARKLWPDATPFPLPGPIHGKAGLLEMTGWEQQEITGSSTPDEILGIGADVLLIMITQAKTLGTAPIVRQTTIARHDMYGEFYLRCVEYPQGGYLIGVIDDKGATYGAPEFYGTETHARDAWVDWVAACNR